MFSHNNEQPPEVHSNKRHITIIANFHLALSKTQPKTEITKCVAYNNTNILYFSNLLWASQKLPISNHAISIVKYVSHSLMQNQHLSKKTHQVLLDSKILQAPSSYFYSLKYTNLLIKL